MDLLTSFLAIPAIAIKFRRDNLSDSLLDNYLALRGLMVRAHFPGTLSIVSAKSPSPVRPLGGARSLTLWGQAQETKQTDESAQQLLDLLNTRKSEQDNRAFIRACVKSLNK